MSTEPMPKKITPAIMIGGSGTRLWPLSRTNMPKQFLRLVGNRTLFQNTLTRVDDPLFSQPWLLTSTLFVELVNAQANQMGAPFEGIILEPLQRGTAAALAAVAITISESDPDALVLAMPADHVIENTAEFIDAVKRAAPLAEASKIVTFGIVPTAPEIGFGYIRPAEPYIYNGQEIGALVSQPGGFLEKPDLDRAKQFVELGYLWNAGIFLFKASALTDELRRLAPETYLAAKASIENGRRRDLGSHVVLMPSDEHFALCPHDVPIDTAVLEKSDSVAVVPCDDIGWADIGSLSALWDISHKDENGNVLKGDGFFSQSRNCFVHAETGRRVVVSNVDDIMVIDSEDAVVVLPRSEAQGIKHVVTFLKKIGAPEINFTRSTTKAWGAVEIDRTFEKGQVCSVIMQENSSVTYRVAGAESEIWLLQGDGTAEYGVEGVFARFASGTPVTFRKGQIVTIRGASDPVRFTYMRNCPDFSCRIDDWFPQVVEVDTVRVRLA